MDKFARRPAKTPLRSSLKSVFFAALFMSAPAQAATLFLENIATADEIANPIYATAPSGDDRLFIVDKDTGDIRIYDRTSGMLLSTPFLTISDLGSASIEEGAQSIAFAPDYETSGKFYVSYVDTGGDHRVVEYMVSGDPNIADAGSARNIITVDHPDDGASGHFGGWIGFGPDDGYLYVSTGDSNADPIDDAAQDINNQLGSILRIDPTADAFPGDDFNNYGVPADNPFVGKDGDDAVWAFGLRNPFRPSFDEETGILYIADVGENQFEEINIGANGANYGWSGYEGSEIFDLSLLTGPTDNLLFPVYEYGHGDGLFEGFSITGGGVYRGDIAELQGRYFFGDFVTGQIWSFLLDPGTMEISDLVAWSLVIDTGVLGTIASFGFDADGNMYLMDIFGDVFLVAGAISDVPLPSAFILMGFGCTAFARTLRKKRARANAEG